MLNLIEHSQKPKDGSSPVTLSMHTKSLIGIHSSAISTIPSFVDVLSSLQTSNYLPPLLDPRRDESGKSWIYKCSDNGGTNVHQLRDAILVSVRWTGQFWTSSSL